MVLTWLARFGHPVVILLGGATGMVGDPSGKDTERPLMSTKVLEGNRDSIQQQVLQILERNGGELAC